MSADEESVYYVHWDGPFALKQITEERAKKMGVYQVYGHHPVYGSDVLLYIGRTKVDFATRLANREVVLWDADANRVQIYLGTIYRDDKELKDGAKENAISVIEPLLIHAHFPAANSSNINSLGQKWEKYKKIRIINTNYRRSLMLEVSGLALLTDYRNYAIVDVLKNEKYHKHFFKDQEENDYILCFGEKFEKDQNADPDFWVGVDETLWEQRGTPLIVAVWAKDKDKLIEFAKDQNRLIWAGEQEKADYFAVSIDVTSEAVEVAIKEMKKIFGLN